MDPVVRATKAEAGLLFGDVGWLSGLDSDSPLSPVPVRVRGENPTELSGLTVLVGESKAGCP